MLIFFSMYSERSQQIFFSKESKRGFSFAFIAFAALEVARLLILTSHPWYSAVAPSLFGSVIFFTAFFALNNIQYKKYAQGALLGWLVFGGVAMGLKILFTI